MPKTAIYCLFEFPGLWANASRSDEETVSVRALEYTTHAYEGATESLLGYQPRYHLLLDSNMNLITEVDGSQTVVVKRNGQPATMPRDLKGISGCPVWCLGDANVPLGQWRDRDSRVIAVQTGIYQESQVVRATRWIAVTTLISEAFSELRGALQLWTPDLTA